MYTKKINLWLALVVAALMVIGCTKDASQVEEAVTSSSTSEIPAAPTSEEDLNENNFEPTRIHFAFDRYDIVEEYRQNLHNIATHLNSNSNVKLVIEGHCDERGTAEYNLGLGERRTLTARRYLIEMGVPVSRLRTVSYGKEFPFDPESNEVAWARNRRAHFVITAR